MAAGTSSLSRSYLVGEVCAHYGLMPADLARRGDHARPRAIAARPGRRSSTVRLRELCRAGVRTPRDARGDPRPARRVEGPGTRNRPRLGGDPGPAAGPPGSRVNPDPGLGRSHSGRDAKRVATRSLRDLYLYV